MGVLVLKQNILWLLELYQIAFIDHVYKKDNFHQESNITDDVKL